MSNETKRDVFEVALNHATKTGWVDYGQLLARYNAALPDELPVIPEAVEEFIRTERQNGTSLAVIFHDAAELNRVRYQGWKIWQHADEMLWAYDHQDAFAQAWLLGEWEMEED